MFDTLQFQLRDSTRVHARRLLPSDAGRLTDGLAALSEESRIQRFHAGLSRLSATQLRYLTEVDQQDHLAWGVEDVGDPSGPGIAVVRAIALPKTPGTAEFALTVIDAYQGRGLGTLLIGLIALDAHHHGITTLMASVRLANTPMLHLLEVLGAERRPSEDGPTVDALLGVADLSAWPDTPYVHRLRATLPGWPE